MFGSTVLDVAIALVFVFLLFSLVVSALNEVWLSFLDKRADFLAEGLAELLQDPRRTAVNHWNPFQKKKRSPAVAHLCDHGLLNALSRRKNGMPSYIDAEAFAAAVLDLIAPADPKASRTLADFRSGVAQIQNEHLKQSLTAILDAADNDLAQFKTGICAWFDRSMERVSGWYKRYVQLWLLFLALALAVGCNVDTVHIVHALSIDPKLRAAMVTEATTYTQKHRSEAAAPAPNDASRPDGTAESTPSNNEDATTKSDVINAVTDPRFASFQAALAALDQLRLPIGWDASERAYLYDKAPRWGHVMSAIFGWFVTALAASLGAPFWFDILQRFVNLRNAGRAPNEKELATKKPEQGEATLNSRP